jgi:ankyrin repeat protein
MHRFLCVLLLCALEVSAQNSDSPNTATPLMRASGFADTATVRQLLANKADVNARNAAGATALMWAAGDLEKVRLLVESGADVNARAESGRTALIIAAAYPGNAEIIRFLLANGADPKLVDRNGDGPVGSAASAADPVMLRELLSKGGSSREVARTGGDFRGYTPLMRAAQANCVECIGLLLAAGAEVDRVSDEPQVIQAGTQARGNMTALLLAAPYGITELVRPLLEHGASLEARDARGMTPLMLAVTSETQNAEVIKLLLSKGAKADVKALDGQSALSWAHKWGSDTGISRLLLERGASPDNVEKQNIPTPHSPTRAPREAIERTLALMQQSNSTFIKKAGCSSCHHQLLSSLLINAARGLAIPVNEELASEQLKKLAAAKQPLREALMQRVSTGTTPIENLMALIALSSLNYPPDNLTDALWHDNAGLQRLDGSWTALNQRPPLVYSPYSATAYAVRGLQLYAPAGRAHELEQRMERARKWFESALPIQNEERAMQLLGLHWTHADRKLILQQAKLVTALQRRDGGWSQRAGFESDAYATGQALFALAMVGAVTPSDPVFHRGVNYLLSTQHDDGSWYVRSRSVKFQPYFESGFPYGQDQWISAAGTNWAALALTLAVQK